MNDKLKKAIIICACAGMLFISTVLSIFNVVGAMEGLLIETCAIVIAAISVIKSGGKISDIAKEKEDIKDQMQNTLDNLKQQIENTNDEDKANQNKKE